MTAPLIHMTSVVKSGPFPAPLRVADLIVARGDRLAVSGLDPTAAELFLNLVTGASVPDEGRVLVAGHDTRAIGTDTEWLRSLDRFGIVTHRAVLVGPLSVAANLALPFTLSIDPMSEDVRARVETLAEEAGLSLDRLSQPASGLDVHERARVHLARAVATGPEVLLLEHVTAPFTAPGASADFGATLARLARQHQIGWVALTDDAQFARASGSRRVALDSTTGRLGQPGGFWRSLLGR
jgi:predicted ABC-type transport system involved in lysophospholipase L1 biosynthesis ATPase subunit